MGNTIAILRKELFNYFASPTSYLVTAVFWLVAGIFLANILGDTIELSARADFLAAQLGQFEEFDAAGAFLQRFLSFVVFLFLFVLPMLTMGLYAEERRRGTMELLATSPLTNWSVAVGKWLAALLFCIAMVLPLMGFEAIALDNTEPAMNFAVWVVAHIGLFLMASAILSLGLFVSSLTENTVFAAIGTFVVVLVMWVIDGLAGEGTGWVASTLRHLSLLRHFESWLQGVITPGSVVLFLSLTVFGLVLTVQSVEALRWQQ